MEKRVWHVKWRLNRSVVGYGRIECKSTPDSTSAVRKKVVATWIAFQPVAARELISTVATRIACIDLGLSSGLC
jgi:hypothetical protein